jgi:gas vesicle protein
VLDKSGHLAGVKLGLALGLVSGLAFRDQHTKEQRVLILCEGFPWGFLRRGRPSQQTVEHTVTII